ncbi:hypothetical protein B0H16DRAFT_1736341 [Mycena metata]|uniref:Uncharacterized protein n=1 Tax=Mycena metata TaxID=1033252 RepID=A0AAD7HQF8_9AGAR|nr:hypothetical protein B0H16DRAFT_1736341 [Mycena metata]
MNVHEQHYFHVYTQVVVDHLVYSFHVRFLGHVDVSPDISFYPTVTAPASIVIGPGQGCSFVLEYAGGRINWLLVPPFTMRECHRVVTRFDPKYPPVSSPSTHHYKRDIYVLRPRDILCSAHLAFQHRSSNPPRFEYTVHSIFSRGFVERGSFLVSPATWRGRAYVRERVSVDIMSSLLECVLVGGRIVWVRVPNEIVRMDEGIFGVLFRFVRLVWRWLLAFTRR